MAYDNHNRQNMIYGNQPFDYTKEVLPQGIVFGGLDKEGSPIYYNTLVPPNMQFPWTRQQMLTYAETIRQQEMANAKARVTVDHQEELRRKYSTLSDYRPNMYPTNGNLVIDVTPLEVKEAQEELQKKANEPAKVKQQETYQIDVEALNAYNTSMLKGTPSKAQEEIAQHAKKLEEDASRLTTNTMGDIDNMELANGIYKEVKDKVEKREVNISYPIVDGDRGLLTNDPNINRSNCGLVGPNCNSANPDNIYAFNYGFHTTASNYRATLFHTANMPVVYAIDKNNVVLKSSKLDQLANDIMFVYPEDFRDTLAPRKDSTIAAEGLYVVEDYRIQRTQGQSEESWQLELEYLRLQAGKKPGLNAQIDAIENLVRENPTVMYNAFKLTAATFIHATEFLQHENMFVPSLGMVVTIRLDRELYNPYSKEYKAEQLTLSNKDITVVTMEVINNAGSDVKNYYVSVGNKDNPITIKSNTSSVKEEGLYVNVVNGLGTREDFIPKDKFKTYDIYDNPEDVATRDYNKDLLKKLELETRQRELDSNNYRIKMDKLRSDMDLELKKKQMEFEDYKRESEKIKHQFELERKEKAIEHEKLIQDFEQVKHEFAMEKEKRKVEIMEQQAEMERKRAETEHSYQMQKQQISLRALIDEHRYHIEKLDRKAQIDKKKAKYDILRQELNMYHDHYKHKLDNERYMRNMYMDEIKHSREMERENFKYKRDLMEYREQQREDKMKTITGVLSQALKLGGMSLLGKK